MLSEKTLERAFLASRDESSYSPNEQVQRLLGSRSIVMFVAPAAMGKTYLMNAVRSKNEEFGLSSTVSTREPRPDDDPNLFRILDHTDENINLLLDKVEAGDMAQYAIHPTEGTFYGSEPFDHPYQVNMLATLSGATKQIRRAGFLTSTIVGLVSPPAEWSSRFDSRYPLEHPNRQSRLKEADKSYVDLLERDDVTWIINREGEVQLAAEQVLYSLDHPTKQRDEEAVAYAIRIRQLIEDAKRLSYTE